MTVQTIEQFFTLIHQTVNTRREAVRRLLRSEDAGGLSAPLKESLQALRRIPREPTPAAGSPRGASEPGPPAGSPPTAAAAGPAGEGGLYRLSHGKREVRLELSYELEELQRDVLYLEKGEQALLAYLKERHPRFGEEVKTLTEALGAVRFRNLVTDRDGTVNNYCGRYRSSVQPAYNGMFLARYAALVSTPVLLTSAPLRDFGLADLSVLPAGSVVYAGSKGREYLTRSGEYCSYPIDREEQEMLDRLNRRLEELLSAPGYRVYGMIGSGLQLKFGQTTIARQDINHSIPDQESVLFLNVVRNLVRDLDPDRRYFRIEDTGLDIEIILTIQDPRRPGELKDFDKGDGVRFLDRELGMGLGEGPNLVCGDTRSDIQMVRASVEATENTWSVFVSQDPGLRETLTRECPHPLFASSPDVLVVALGTLGARAASGS